MPRLFCRAEQFRSCGGLLCPPARSDRSRLRRRRACSDRPACVPPLGSSEASTAISTGRSRAAGGYQGPKFAKALAKVLPHLNIEIVKRSDQVSGFVVLPKRWIVERTIGGIRLIYLLGTFFKSVYLYS